MNIFASDACPVQSAMALDDKRLVKMCLETAQILSSVMRKTRGDAVANQLGLYKATHANHPCVRWAENDQNLSWLVDHGFSLCLEFSLRFKKVHSSMQVIMAVSRLFPEPIDHLGITFQNSARNKTLDLDFSDLPVHEAYRAYLNARWNTDKTPPKWTTRQPPEWRNSHG